MTTKVIVKHVVQYLLCFMKTRLFTLLALLLMAGGIEIKVVIFQIKFLTPNFTYYEQQKIQIQNAAGVFGSND